MYLDKTRSVLIECSRTGNVISYSDLVGKAELPFDISNINGICLLSELLAKINSDCLLNKEPLLGVVAVRKDTSRPGGGFFSFAEENNLLPVGSSEVSKDAFFVQTLNDVFLFFK
jgi:hypothetical protein